MGTTLSLIFRRLATKFSNLVQKKNPPGGRGGGKGGHPWTIHRWSYLVWAYADICPSKVLGNTKVTVSSMDDSGLSTAPSDDPHYYRLAQAHPTMMHESSY